MVTDNFTNKNQHSTTHNDSRCTKNSTGIVIIGRNEGERLKNCIASIPNDFRSRTVYVDSGSTDDSIYHAANQGLITLSLDLDLPFTAARARNTGFNHLLDKFPDLQFVHFIDGDCSFADGWLEQALNYLENNAHVALVCGRRREIYPDASIYNWLCDIEWNTPVGVTNACGGDFLVRSECFRQVDGFNSDLIAGEEPELCYRLRQTGKMIVRLDHDMTLHDANIHSFKQWFRRNMRAGYAFTEGVFMYLGTPDGYWRKELLRIVFWGILLPFIIIAATIINKWYSLFLLIYPLQATRISLKVHAKRKDIRFGIFMVLGKFPEALGMLNYLINRLTKTRRKLIEYK